VTPDAPGCYSLAAVCARNPAHATCSRFVASGGNLNSLAPSTTGSSSSGFPTIGGTGSSRSASGESGTATDPNKKPLDPFETKGNNANGRGLAADGKSPDSHYDSDGPGGSGIAKVGPVDATAQGNGFDIGASNGLTMMDRNTGRELNIWQRTTRRHQGFQGTRILMFARMETMRKKAMTIAQGDRDRAELSTSRANKDAASASKPAATLK